MQSPYLTPHLELGQYFATAQFLTGQYQYAGSRTKVHFGLGDPQTWPLAFGGNIEVAYMRRKAEENPLTLEVRPIVEARLGHWWMVADFAFEQPFSGPGTHAGVTFAPSGLLSYELLPWLTPALEYYGDLGPLRHLPGVQQQQHFLVPPLNLHLLPQLEVNVGVGFGVTRASQGMFLKSILGWTFSSSVPERDRARNVKARAWASRSAGSYQCISLFVNDIEHIGACHAVGGYMWTLYRSVSCFQRFT